MPIHIALIVVALLGAMLPLALWLRRATDMRRQAEKVARESEARYRTLFEILDDFIFLYPMTGEGALANFLEVNEVACQRLGYSRQELLRLSLPDLLAPEDMAALLHERAILLRDRRQVFEKWVVARSEERLPLEFRARLFDSGGQPLVLAVARDISERKRLEQVLTDAEVSDQLRRAGPAQAAHFSWRKTAEATLALYRQS